MVIDRAAEALDRAIKARDVVERDGMVSENSRGTATPHPLLQVEQLNRAAFVKITRELGLVGIDDLAGLSEAERASRLAEARSFASSRRGRSVG